MLDFWSQCIDTVYIRLVYESRHASVYMLSTVSLDMSELTLRSYSPFTK